MFNALIDHNCDIRQLVDKGYAVAFDSGCMIIRDIPYLDASKQLQIGAIVTKLVFVDRERVKQDDHQVFFAGTFPHNLDGKPIPNLGGGPTTLPLGEAGKDVVVQRSFSNKPSDTGAFKDFYEKIESYVGIISGPAMQVFDVSPLTFRAVESVPDSVFKFHDTLTSRAEITDLSARFKDDIIAIIGLGGTGAYILDFLTKVPVREIRGFDNDLFYVHNAFRAPGRLDVGELDRPKAEVYSSRYENFRHGVTLKRKFVDAASAQDLVGVTFAFVCVDKGSSRAGILELLLSRGIPFIDVGMGLNRREGLLTGLIRTTYFSAKDGHAVRDKGLVELSEKADDLYRTNIQICELNALNACLAVIRYKQLRGFYAEEIPYLQLLFDVSDLKTVGELSSRPMRDG